MIILVAFHIYLMNSWCTIKILQLLFLEYKEMEKSMRVGYSSLKARDLSSFEKERAKKGGGYNRIVFYLLFKQILYGTTFDPI